MTWKNIDIKIPLKDCIDSLLFNEGEIIATIESENNTAKITVCVAGETKIRYNGETYRYADKFPEELINAIKTGEVWKWEENGKVEIFESNWFEFNVSNNNEVIDATVWNEDFSNMTDQQFANSLTGYYDQCYPEIN